MNLKEVWFTYDLMQIDSFKLVLDLSECKDVDDLKKLVMSETRNFNLHKFAVFSNDNHTLENEPVENVLEKNSFSNPIRFVRIKKIHDINETKESSGNAEENNGFVWCSIEGYIPTKIRVDENYTLEDVMKIVCLKFLKVKPNYICYVNDKEMDLKSKIYDIKLNSFKNPIIFTKQKFKPKGRLHKILSVFKIKR